MSNTVKYKVIPLGTDAQQCTRTWIYLSPLPPCTMLYSLPCPFCYLPLLNVIYSSTSIYGNLGIYLFVNNCLAHARLKPNEMLFISWLWIVYTEQSKKKATVVLNIQAVDSD